ncbi:MAG: hypothetical protein WA860_08375, partial [Acidimicrobiales bacterium]
DMVVKIGIEKHVSEALCVLYWHLEPRVPGVVGDEFVSTVAERSLIGRALACGSVSEILTGCRSSQIESPQGEYQRDNVDIYVGLSSVGCDEAL